MYPCQIHTLVRKGSFVTDDIRRRIQEKTKKSSTVEDTKRIVGAIYESNSQPFMYYDVRTDQMSDEPRNTSLNSVSKRRSATSSSQSYGNIEGSSSLSTGSNSSCNHISSSSLENLKENIFKIFEEKGSEGVSLKEIEDRTMKPKHIVKKIIEEIAVQAGRGGRRHIWHLKPQFITN